MKKIICAMCLFVMLCASNVLSAELEGFMGVKWGASRSDFADVMAANGGVIATVDNDRNYILMYTGVNFAGEEVAAVRGMFLEDKLCKVLVFVKPLKEFKIVKEYNDWKNKIEGKYGEPDLDHELFSSPYEKGDGYETQAIKNGKAEFAAFWFFNPDRTGDSISLQIDSSMYIVIAYEDEELLDQFLARMKQEQQKDL